MLLPLKIVPSEKDNVNLIPYFLENTFSTKFGEESEKFSDGLYQFKFLLKFEQKTFDTNLVRGGAK